MTKENNTNRIHLQQKYPLFFLLLVLISANLLFVSAARAQSNIAYPENAIDSRLRTTMRVDPVSHGLQFQITLGSYPGRGGAGMPITLFYSSKLWRLSHQSTVGGPGPDGMIYPLDSIYRADYAESSAAGWTSNLDWFLYPSGENPIQLYDQQGFPSGNTGYSRVARMHVRLPDGSKHELRRDDNVYSAANFNESGIYYAVDGSRLRYETASQTLFLPDGSRYIGSTQFIDRHGNKLVYNYSSRQWTDTLGRSFNLPLPPQNTVGESSTAAVRDETYNLPGIGTASVSYTFRWRRLGDVLTDATQALRSKGDRVRKENCEMVVESLFSSPIYCGAGTDEDHRLMSTAVFNPVVLHEIVFPDGSFYKFTYSIYGEIDKVAYPTGSYEKFQHGAAPTLSGHFSGQFDDFYSQGNRGVSNRRISADGTGQDEVSWSYAGGQAGSYPNNVPTRRVTAPDGSFTESRLHAVNSSDLILYGFDDPRAGMAFDERAYTAGGQILTRKLTEWQVDGTVVGSPPFVQYKTRNPRPAKEVSIVFDAGGDALASTTVYQYDTDLNPTVVSRFNYAVVDSYTAQNGDISQIPTGTLARSEETDYLWNYAYRDRNMLSLPTETRVKDAFGNLVAKSQIVYDEAAYPIIDYGVATNWENPNTAYRGNPTTVRSWFDIAANQYVETHAQYDNFGNLRKAWDAKGNISEVEYSSTYNYAYPTKTISPIPDPSGVNGSTTAFETISVYDFNTGLPTSSTDINGPTTTKEYNDALLRPTKVTAPNGHQTITEYGAGTSESTRFVKVRSQIDATNWKEGYSWFDGLGRGIKSQSVNASTGDVFVETEYDNMGRAKKTTNPYRTGDTKLWTENTFDAAGRLWKVTTPDNAVVETLYSVATLGSVLGTAVTVKDQALKERRSVTNALGHLMRVDEPTASGLGTISSPNQATTYAYDPLNNLTTVTQGVQTRTFTYDALSRLKSAANPESGMVNYTYDANGNLATKKDARSITTTYTYDLLNRVKVRDYSDSTPDVTYYYDNLPNAKGKLIKAASSVSSTEYTAFDVVGRVTDHKQTTGGIDYATSYTYNLSGALLTETYPSGRQVRNFYAAPNGDLTQVQTRTAAGMRYHNRADDFVYNAAGAVQSLMLGNGKYETTQFNSRLQPTQIGLGTSVSDTSLLKLEYNYGATQNNGNILTQTITVSATDTNPGFMAAQTYTYDELNRIKLAAEVIGSTETWRQTFLYDRYGNRSLDVANSTKPVEKLATELAPPTEPEVIPLVLQKASAKASSESNKYLSEQGYTYDAGGNITQDAYNRSFVYDAENRQTSVSDGSGNIGTYSYDGDGKRVKKTSASDSTIFVYDAAGKLIEEYPTGSPTAVSTSYVYAGSRLLSTEIVGRPTPTYLTADHLGSPRINTDGSGAVVARHDYQPFGEEIPRSGYGGDSMRKKFTGYERDIESSLDFAQARYYSSAHGRFTTTDPIFIQAGMIVDPQRFNLYAYVRNNPNKFVDTDGEILRLSGDLTFLRGMIDQWAGDLKDKISVADDGTVTFNVKPKDIKGNEAAQFLYDLVNDAETMLFYAGTEAEKAGSFVEENKDSKSLSREQLKKQFTGEAYAAGGGYFVATRGRVTDAGGAATGTPIDGIFAVIAFNADAHFFEIQGVSDTDSRRNKKKDPADLSVPLSAFYISAFYIHEGAENLDFARQKREGITLNSSAYRTAHSAAIARENKIREQIQMVGGKAGGSIRSIAPKNKN